jgi:hypothetical protein
LPDLYALLDGARADLTAPDEILALMAQDLNTLRREHHSVTMHELQSLGWTSRQLLNHFQPALEEAHRSWCDSAPNEPAAKQSKPFIDFDRAMKAKLAAGAHAPASDDANEVA